MIAAPSVCHYDYSSPGTYFVALCVQDRACLFGEVVEDETRLNACGEMVRDEWRRTPEICPDVGLDAFVVLPNHVHGVIVIAERVHRCGGEWPVGANAFHPPSQTLGAIVCGFKGTATKCINQMRGTSGERVWQRDYYEHVVRGRRDLERIRRYIA